VRGLERGGRRHRAERGGESSRGPPAHHAGRGPRHQDDAGRWFDVVKVTVKPRSACTSSRSPALVGMPAGVARGIVRLVHSVIRFMLGRRR